MAGPYEHIKHYADFLGIDLRSNEVLRSRGYSPDGTENVAHSPQGALTMRWGTHIISGSVGCYGLYAFETTDMLGVTKRELIGFGPTSGTPSGCFAHRLVKSSFTITNSNAAAAALYHYYDESASQFVFKVVRSGSSVVSQNLGIGTEGSPYMRQRLASAVIELAQALAPERVSIVQSSPNKRAH